MEMFLGIKRLASFNRLVTVVLHVESSDCANEVFCVFDQQQVTGELEE